MLSIDRVYHFIGELTLERSKQLDPMDNPDNDEVNWLFLDTGNHQFSFVYKIKNGSDATYKKPFRAFLSFTSIEAARDILKLNQIYRVARGPEVIGTVKIIDELS